MNRVKDVAYVQAISIFLAEAQTGLHATSYMNGGIKPRAYTI
jgi:hypothetical protein